MWSVPWAPQISFADELVLQMPALERLEYVLGTFSDELSVRPLVTRSVKDLRPAFRGADCSPHEAGLTYLLERVGQRGMALTKIEVFSKSGDVRSQLAGLASACGGLSVTLRWTE